MTTSDIQWSIEIESVDGSSHDTIDSSNTSVRVLSWRWETRDRVLAAVLNIEIDNAVKFYPKYQENNPFGLGAKIILRFEGIRKFTGWVNTHEPVYGPDERNLKLEYKDKAGLLNYAGLSETGQTQILRKRLMLEQRKSGSIIFYSPEFSGSATFPWAEDYVVPLFSGSGVDDAAKRIPLSEYQILYSVGGVAFNNATVRYMGDSSSGMPLADLSVWAHVPYYNLADQSMRVSNILKRAFEYSQISGGVGWTDGVDFDIQVTPNDVINRLKWISDESDGSISDLIAWMYDNPAIGLAPSYQIGDFDGLGVVKAKLISQNPLAAKDIQFPTEAQFPSSITNIYSRCVVTNKNKNRVDISRFQYPDDNLLVPWHDGGVPGAIYFGNANNIRDYAVRTSYGAYKEGVFSEILATMNLPQDYEIARYVWNLKSKTVDTIAINATWPWTKDDNVPVLPDNNKAMDMIHRNMVMTVEWSAFVNPGPEDWFPIHPDLYLFEVDVLGGKEAWKIVENIDLENVRTVRLVINSPLFAKFGEWGTDAIRRMIWFISEFRVYGKGNAVDLNTGEIPEIRFTDNSGSIDRYRPDLANQIINGTFTSSSGWNIGTGWTISGGKANKIGDGVGYLEQGMDISSGSIYCLEYEIEDLTVANVTPVIGETSGVTRSDNGIFYEQIQAVGSTDFRFVPSNASRFRIDNVKVTEAIDMYRPKLTNKLAFMGLPWKTLTLEAPDVFDFSGSGSLGNKIMTTQLDWYSKENNWEVDIIPQPNLKRGDTVYCSRAKTPYFTVVGIQAEYNGTDTSMRISLVDYETKVEGGE